MTTADPYCFRSDVTKRLPPGTLVSASGLVASALGATDLVTYDGHGFETNDQLSVRATENGALPAPLVEGTVYYAVRFTNATFKLAAAVDGSPINLTSDAVSMVVMREPDFDTWIEFYSRWAETSLPAHAVPLGRTEAVHPLVRGLVADLVAKRMFNVGGQASTTIDQMEIAAVAQLERYGAGIPLRGAPVPESTNLAVSGRPVTQSDPFGCGRSGAARIP